MPTEVIPVVAIDAPPQVVTSSENQSDVEAHSDSGDSSWDAIRADDSLQFSPVEAPPQEPPPEWLAKLLEAIGDLFAPVGRAIVYAWPVLFWVLLALVALLFVYLIWRLAAPYFGAPKAESAAEDHWAPEREEALALLSEADRLAEAGQYDEATHLLLKRSVGQIAEARPDWLEPSSTAREIASLPALPDKARTAFGTISERVERSLFALRKLGVDDWQAARDAYADFALEKL